MYMQEALRELEKLVIKLHDMAREEPNEVLSLKLRRAAHQVVVICRALKEPAQT